MTKMNVLKRVSLSTNESSPACASTRAAADSLKVSYPQESDALSTATIDSVRIERINDRELNSINALLAYVSYNQNVRQETVAMVVEAQFGVDNVAKIKRADYMHAIEFLVDLRMEEMMN